MIHTPNRDDEHSRAFLIIVPRRSIGVKHSLVVFVLNNQSKRMNYKTSSTLRRRNLKTAFTLKTHQMFAVHTRPESCKTATITDHFGFVFEEDSDGEIARLFRHSFSKTSVFKMFSVPH